MKHAEENQVRGGRGADLFEQSGCNENSQNLQRVDRWMTGERSESEDERRNRVKSNCRQIFGPDNGSNGPREPQVLGSVRVCIFCLHIYKPISITDSIYNTIGLTHLCIMLLKKGNIF